jgi:hypothetical protein
MGSPVVTTRNYNTVKITVIIARKIRSSTPVYCSLLGNESYLVNTSQLNTQLLNCLLNSLVNDFLAVRRMLYEESLTQICWTELTSMRTEYISPSRTVNCPLLSFFFCHWNAFVNIRCSGNLITEPLPSNGRALRLHHPSF